MKEYSKRIVKAMILLWFIGAAFGAAVIVVELIATMIGSDSYSGMGVTVHLPELLAYIGAPVGGGVVGYLLKSAFENREKIKQNYTPGYEPGENLGGYYE